MKKISLSIFLIILITFSSALSTLAATSATTQEVNQGQVTVSHLSVVNVTTTAGTAPVLPSTVIATMSDGTTKTVNVNWGTISQRTSTGNFIVIGTIAESTTVKAIATIKVADVNQVNILTIQQVQQDIIGTWKTSDQKYSLEFHEDGTLVETELRNGYTVTYEDHYSFSSPTRIKIVNSNWAENNTIVLKKNLLTIYGFGVSRLNSSSTYISDKNSFIHPTFSQSSSFFNYEFVKVSNI